MPEVDQGWPVKRDWNKIRAEQAIPTHEPNSVPYSGGEEENKPEQPKNIRILFDRTVRKIEDVKERLENHAERIECLLTLSSPHLERPQESLPEECSVLSTQLIYCFRRLERLEALLMDIEERIEL